MGCQLSVFKMLRHTNIQTTQHYPKILDIKVGAHAAARNEIRRFLNYSDLHFKFKV